MACVSILSIGAGKRQQSVKNMSMTYLLSYYPGDAAGENMASNLQSILADSDIEPESLNGTDFGPLYKLGDHYLLETPRQHIYLNDLEPGVEVNGMVFMSRHSSESGKPCLTVHAMGNFLEASEDHGGRSSYLSSPMPREEAALLCEMKANARGLSIPVSLEATHHGPALDIPCLNIEIGSTMDAWTVPEYGEAVAKAIYDVIYKEKWIKGGEGGKDEARDEGGPDGLNRVNDGSRGSGGRWQKIGIGLGGGHYAPRFTDVVNRCDLCFGHIIPTYIFDSAGDGNARKLIRMAKDRTPGAKYAYFDRKALKGGRYGRYKEIAAGLGLEPVRMKHLDCQK